MQPPKTQTAKSLSAKALTEGQRAYESKRAAKAGMSLGKWLASKEREREAEAESEAEGRPGRQTAKAARLLRPLTRTRPAAAWVLASPRMRIGVSIRENVG